MRRTKRVFYQSSLFIFLILIPGGLVNAQTKTDEDCRPLITMGSLLDNVKINSSGRLSIGRLYAVCLPAPMRRSKTNYAYHPYDGGKLSAELGAGGEDKALNTFVFYGEKFTTLWELPRHEILGGAESLKQLSDGKYYDLNFLVEDQRIMRFPFSVSVVESRDAYRPQKFYLTNGPWNDYAEIFYPNPNRYMQMRVWLRDTENAGLEPRVARYDLELIREADKKVLATGGGERSGMRLTHEWQGFNLSFRPAGGAGPEEAAAAREFSPAELLKTDGRYRVNLSVGGKPYGAYFFDVRGGQFRFVPHGTNPLVVLPFPLATSDKGFPLWRNKP